MDTTTPPRFKAALIGLGRIASLLEDDEKREKPASHAGALTAHGGFELVAGCDSQAERRQLFGQRWNLPEAALYDNPQALLAEHQPDLLVIATWPDSHQKLVELGARHRIPLILCEKPLAPTIGASQAMIRACRKAGSYLMVNHERRYARDYSRLRLIILDDRYGKLVSVAGKLFMGRGRTPAEVLFWDGTHLLDVLRFVTGCEITHTKTRGPKHRQGASVHSTFRLGPTLVHLETATDRDHLTFELDCSFERGRVRIGNGLYEEWVGGESPYYEKMRSLLPVEVPRDQLYPTGYFSGMAADAWDVLNQRRLGQPRPPVSQGEDGLAAVRAIKALLR